MKSVLAAIIFFAALSADLPDAEARAMQGHMKVRIVDGNRAYPGQFPWHVVLKRDAIDDLLCGGSIISPTWVLTAAHCTYGLSSIYLMFGTISMFDQENNQTSTNLIVHPQYNPNGLFNDISLIQLSKPLVFSETVQPIPLVPPSNNKFVGTIAVASGYGLRDDENMEASDFLEFAFLEIIANKECEQVFGPVIVNSTMCAKGANNSIQSICTGDSGGPLIVKDTSGNFMQVGISSFVAQDNCAQGFPGAFARLSYFIDYIRGVTGLENLGSSNLGSSNSESSSSEDDVE